MSILTGWLIDIYNNKTLAIKSNIQTKLFKPIFKNNIKCLRSKKEFLVRFHFKKMLGCSKFHALHLWIRYLSSHSKKLAIKGTSLFSQYRPVFCTLVRPQKDLQLIRFFGSWRLITVNHTTTIHQAQTCLILRCQSWENLRKFCSNFTQPRLVKLRHYTHGWCQRADSQCPVISWRDRPEVS